MTLVATSPLAGQVEEENAFPTDTEREATIRRAHTDAETVGTAGYLQAFRARLSERRRKAARNGGLIGAAAGLGFLLFVISATGT